MLEKPPSSNPRSRILAGTALLALGISACTIRIGPYEGDDSAWDTPNPSQETLPEQAARQAEVDAHLEQLKIVHHIVAETPQDGDMPRLWWAAPSTEPAPYDVLNYLPWKTLEELLPPPGIELPQTELDLAGNLSDPQGTLPMLPPDFSAYIMGDTDATSLQDYLDRHQIFGMPAGQDRLYAGLESSEANRGISATINHFVGEVEDHTLSLVEIAVACPKEGPPQEVIGVMLALDRANPKSRRQHAEQGLQPRLHVEYIRQVNGREKGVWDVDEAGFEPLRYDWGDLGNYVKLPGRTLLGGKVSVSSLGGKQVEHRIDIFQVPWGDWWIAYRGELLGRYPAGLFSLLNSGACRAQWYSEVYDGTPVNWTFTDMGSGQFAEAGLNQAAYIRQPKFRDLNWLEMVPLDKFSEPNEPACYTRSKLILKDPLLGDHVFYGGPGGGAMGCN